MRTVAMTKRIIKQIVGDKRTIALLFVAPIMVLFLMSIILNTSITTPKLVISKDIAMPIELINALKEYAIITDSELTLQSQLEALENKRYDGVIEFEENKLRVTVEGSESFITGAVKKAVASAASDYSKELIANNEMLRKLDVKLLENEIIYRNGGEDQTTFESIAPMMMGFFIFFFVFLLAGISFLRERISGTLERLVATPIKRYEIVLGYFFGFGFFITLQTIIIQCFMIYGLQIAVKGSFLLVLLINILLAAGSLTLGTLLSAFAKNEFQLFQFIPLIIVPQILFCGIFSLREAPQWVQLLSKVFPLTYGADALTGVVLRGESFSQVILDIAVLTGYAIVFLILNTLALKKYRKL